MQQWERAEEPPLPRRERLDSVISSAPSYGGYDSRRGSSVGGGGAAGDKVGGASLEMLAMSDSELSDGQEQLRDLQLDLTLIGEGGEESGTPSSDEEEDETPPHSGDEGGEKALESLAMSDSELEEEKGKEEEGKEEEEEDEEEEEEGEEEEESLPPSESTGSWSAPSLLQLGSSIGSLSSSSEGGEGGRKEKGGPRVVRRRSRRFSTRSNKRASAQAAEAPGKDCSPPDTEQLLSKLTALESSHRQLQESFGKERKALWVTINRQAQTIHLLLTERNEDLKRNQTYYRDFQQRLQVLERGGGGGGGGGSQPTATFGRGEYYV